jgi:hypothetical protein
MHADSGLSANAKAASASDDVEKRFVLRSRTQTPRGGSRSLWIIALFVSKYPSLRLESPVVDCEDSLSSSFTHASVPSAKELSAGRPQRL